MKIREEWRELIGLRDRLHGDRGWEESSEGNR